MNVRGRTKRMPLGTFCWMPFFERKVQSILEKLRTEKGERFALWAYCEVAAFAIGHDPKSFKSKHSLENFELVFIRDPFLVSELLGQVVRFRAGFMKRPQRRHEIAAYSEAEESTGLAEKIRLGMISATPKILRRRNLISLRTALIKAIPGIEHENLSWKNCDQFKKNWHPNRVGVFAEAERKRRNRILKRWLLTADFASSILTKS